MTVARRAILNEIISLDEKIETLRVLEIEEEEQVSADEELRAIEDTRERLNGLLLGLLAPVEGAVSICNTAKLNVKSVLVDQIEDIDVFEEVRIKMEREMEEWEKKLEEWKKTKTAGENDTEEATGAKAQMKRERVRPNRPKCSREGCINKATYGVIGIKRRLFCKEHKKDNMLHERNKKWKMAVV